MNDVVLGYALMLVRDKLQQSEHENEQYALASVALGTGGRSSPVPANPHNKAPAVTRSRRAQSIAYSKGRPLYRRLASSRIRASVFSQPKQGSVMDLPNTAPSTAWLPSSR